jgi:hypothetical protein
MIPLKSVGNLKDVSASSISFGHMYCTVGGCKMIGYFLLRPFSSQNFHQLLTSGH